MKDSVVRLRVDAETKSRLTAIAANEGVYESELLRRLIEAGLNGLPPSGVPLLPSSADGYQRKKITITLPAFIADLAIERAAQKKMSLSRWVASLVQGSVFQPPVLTTTELKYLNESNRQIRAIGVNLNQIARAFNQMDIDIRKLKNLDVVEKVVRENLDVIERLLRAVNRSWGIGRGNH